MKRLLSMLLILTLSLSLLPLSSAEEAQGYQPIAYGAEGEQVALVQQLLMP